MSDTNLKIEPALLDISQVYRLLKISRSHDNNHDDLHDRYDGGHDAGHVDMRRIS